MNQIIPLSTFCEGVFCININHKQKPIKYFCFSEDCNQRIQALCVKCLSSHMHHKIIPIEILDELQEDEGEHNVNVRKLLNKFKKAKDNINGILTQLEEKIISMHQKSFQEIIEPFTKSGKNMGTLGSIQKTLQKTVEFHTEGPSLRQNDWNRTLNLIEKEVLSAMDEIERQLKTVVSIKYEHYIQQVSEIDEVLNEINQLKNIGHMTLNMNNIREIDDAIVLKISKALEQNEHIHRLDLRLWYS